MSNFLMISILLNFIFVFFILYLIKACRENLRIQEKIEEQRLITYQNFRYLLSEINDISKYRWEYDFETKKVTKYKRFNLGGKHEFGHEYD